MQPIISGIIGSIIAILLCSWWLKKRPLHISKEMKEKLIIKYKSNIRITNFVVAGIIIFGIIIFKLGYVQANEWRVATLILGCALSSPFISLNMRLKGESSFNEALIAYSIKQKAPKQFLLYIMSFGAVLIMVSILGFSMKNI
jgi:hypothetical protein